MFKHIFKKYPEPLETGYWGKPTSTIDWCEENYVVSPFVAEWSNTITNSAFVALAMYVTWSAYYHKLEKRFVMIGVGLGTVGVGSWLFHMTLRYEYQLLDELPMIYATCIPAWSIFSEEQHLLRNNTRGTPSLIRQSIIGAVVFGSAGILTVVYMLYRDPTIHQTAYAVLNVIVVFSAGAMASKYVHDPLAKRNLRNTMALSISIFLLGYFLWQLDVHFCSFWIFVRRTFLNLPLGVFLELHSWWHLLTGSGVYFYIVHLEYLRILTHGQSNDYTLCWRWKVFPELIHSSRTISTNYSTQFLGSYEASQPSAKVDHAKSE
ncbi:LAME_0H07272g1_1 [Lachancea meyersii CBS 8951]|uniref:LAME_0H07272g1_1 n=1 Tax=Lachancea meyersii CBS 8951 TaxID=1266667 RepID=A0A1G4KES2_9SACH|nr:LAME_0H07272g1_1 [Lachancea meyersii CBS 8951]